MAANDWITLTILKLKLDSREGYYIVNSQPVTEYIEAVTEYIEAVTRYIEARSAAATVRPKP